MALVGSREGGVCRRESCRPLRMGVSQRQIEMVPCGRFFFRLVCGEWVLGLGSRGWRTSERKRRVDGVVEVD